MFSVLFNMQYAEVLFVGKHTKFKKRLKEDDYKLILLSDFYL